MHCYIFFQSHGFFSFCFPFYFKNLSPSHVCEVLTRNFILKYGIIARIKVQGSCFVWPVGDREKRKRGVCVGDRIG